MLSRAESWRAPFQGAKQSLVLPPGCRPTGRKLGQDSLLITTAVYLGLQLYFKKTAGRPDYVDRSKAHTPKVSTLANETHSSISNNQIVNDGNPFDTATGVEITSEKINIAALKNTNLKLKLWGTITGYGVRAYAIIEEPTKQEQKLYRAGETLQNATIKMILRGKVVLNVEGKYEILEIETKQVDVNAKNKYGVTALIDASYRGQKEHVEWLIVEGANLNARDNQGDTALMNAARWGHKENVALLIDEGADIHAKTTSGETALEFAAFSYHKDVVELLKFHGAKE